MCWLINGLNKKELVMPFFQILTSMLFGKIQAEQTFSKNPANKKPKISKKVFRHTHGYQTFSGTAFKTFETNIIIIKAEFSPKMKILRNLWIWNE